MKRSRSRSLFIKTSVHIRSNRINLMKKNGTLSIYLKFDKGFVVSKLVSKTGQINRSFTSDTSSRNCIDFS